MKIADIKAARVNCEPAAQHPSCFCGQKPSKKPTHDYDYSRRSATEYQCWIQRQDKGAIDSLPRRYLT